MDQFALHDNGHYCLTRFCYIANLLLQKEISFFFNKG